MARRALPVLLVVLLVLGLVLTGCGESAKATPTKGAEPTKAAGPPVVVATPTKAPATPKLGGSITVLTASDVTPTNYDPHFIASGRREFYHPVYEPLFTRDRATSKVLPLLAESYEFSADAKSITVKLRKGVKWQNIAPVSGREFTSDDVKWNIERMAFSDPASMQKTFVTTVTSVETPDKYTAKINFGVANAPFMMYLASPGTEMYPRELVDQYGKEQAKVIVGTGPYMLKAIEKDVSATYTRNPDYHTTGLPRLDSFTLAVVRGDAGKMAAMRSGQADIMTDMRFLDVEQLKGSMTGLQTFPYTSYEIHLRLNTKSGPTSDARVRKAIWLAIDRQDLIKAVEKGSGAVSGLIGPAAVGFARSEQDLLKLAGYRLPKDQDIAEAKKLLAEAGFAGGLPLECVTASAYPAYLSSAEALVEQLGKVGIKLTIKPMESTAFSAFSMNKSSEFNTVLTGGGGVMDPDGLQSIFSTTGVTNIGNYGTPEVDSLLAAGRAEVNEAKRVQIYRDLEDKMFERASVIALYSQNLYWVARAGVEDILPVRYPGSIHYYGEALKHPWLSK